MRIMTFNALGLLAVMAMPAAAAAQYRQGYYGPGDHGVTKVEREYRKKLAEERRECGKKKREADSRGEWIKAQRECRQKLAEVEREYRKKFREERFKSGDGRYDRDDDDD